MSEIGRRAFFGILGKVAALAASAKVLPFVPPVPIARDVITFDGPDPAAQWYGPPGACNWTPRTMTWKGGGTPGQWADPKNWEVN